MRVSASEFFFQQLAEADSYWGMRYTDLRRNAYDSFITLRCLNVQQGCHKEPGEAEIHILAAERNRVGKKDIDQSAKPKLHGAAGFQLIQTLASLAPSALTGVLFSIIIFVPLHILGELAEDSAQYSQHSFFFIDIKSIKEPDRKAEPDTGSMPSERISTAPPKPPANLRLE